MWLNHCVQTASKEITDSSNFGWSWSRLLRNQKIDAVFHWNRRSFSHQCRQVRFYEVQSLKTRFIAWKLSPRAGLLAPACGPLQTVTKSWCGCSPPCALCCDGRRAGKVRISRLGDIDLSLMPRPWSERQKKTHAFEGQRVNISSRYSGRTEKELSQELGNGEVISWILWFYESSTFKRCMNLQNT